VLNRFADERDLESASANPADKALFQQAVVVLRELTQILGVLDQPLPAADTDAIGTLAPKLLDLFLSVRQELRKAKQYALADRVREQLAELGVTIEDRAEGSRWKLG
jgi:cysteinyl-tRNA synthetase